MAIIEAKTKQDVMDVLLDPQGNYSVCGYAERMEKAFGQIFLGRDQSDPEYGRQSAPAVAAIGAITEDAAFDAALAETRVVMQALGGAATFKMADVVDTVLAAVCRRWFDLPDGQFVVVSGSTLPVPFGTANCPGHYAPPSGYIFQPEPDPILSQLGKWDGAILHTQVGKFVAQHRQAGTAPGGPISSALFAAFPAGEEETLTRTLIGVMMGFLPTAQRNLNTVAEAWKDQMFGVLRAAYLSDPEANLKKRADRIIRDPMIEAMQVSPTPPKIWRTAKTDHMLGGAQVKAGDLLYVNIIDATHEDITKINRDPFPIFGGDRSQNPHPTHACPGFKAAMGVMLGIFAGTMEAPGSPDIR